mmetsp:Transcript_5799/g.11847  ORF Transcript_5799/g.11847 Transcript_5799/m.11847 type:complete len:148 (+) Transcript_5799:66-509(+)
MARPPSSRQGPGHCECRPPWPLRWRRLLDTKGDDMTADLCSYTEYRIYPGTGQRYYAKDGKVSFFFIGKKAESLFHQRIKPVKLHRTQAWRHMNKKGMANEQVKKRIRKSQKFQKAIVGLKIQDLVLPVPRIHCSSTRSRASSRRTW